MSLTSIITNSTYAILAGAAYNDNRGLGNTVPDSSLPPGWTILPQFTVKDNSTDAPPLSNPYQTQTSSGFAATTFQNGNNIVISFEGTDFLKNADDSLSNQTLKDGIADLALGAGVGSQQIVEAAELYEKVRAANPYANITFTGHSLGAGLASIMAVWFQRQAVVFDDAPFLATAQNTAIAERVNALRNERIFGEN